MAYQTPLTIKATIDKIRRNEYVLPAIQREFVWGQDQIVKLFDSLMREYPISTFLLWKVSKEKVGDFQFYSFLSDYHQRDKSHNDKISPDGSSDITAILDGQQRLTSLYVALCGSHAVKKPYYSWDSPKAFPTKKLYLNLLGSTEDIELKYNFAFLADDEIENDSENHWFKVGDVLAWDDLTKVMNYVGQNGLMDSSKYGAAGQEAMNILAKLHHMIHKEGAISYYEEVDSELDKVLQIFIRINSGGTKLSYSDLLLSIATAQWQELDAREEIHRFVDEINAIGEGFEFNKDFVLKSCLVLGDFNDVKFKVDNFKRENMLKIEGLWVEITEAIRNAVKLVATFGFDSKNLTSTNAVIPIAYYLMHNKHGNEYVAQGKYSEDRKKIKQWLIRVLVKGIFGSTPDSLYPIFRSLIRENAGKFPLEGIIERLKSLSNKSIVFTDDDIEQVLSLEYKYRRTYAVLTLLYPALIRSFKFHKDHIHPRKFFTTTQIGKRGITDAVQVEKLQKLYNQLPNLQLLEALDNTEKNAATFRAYLYEKYPDEQERAQFKQLHYIPAGVSLELEDFEHFFNARKELLRVQLKNVLS